jgi:hypothetical protein
MPSAGWSRVQLACRKASGFVLTLSGSAITAHGAQSGFGSGRAPSAVQVNAGAASPDERSRAAFQRMRRDRGRRRSQRIPTSRASCRRSCAGSAAMKGELNGVWTPATRRAMKTFTDRVNATLPVDEPDAVLFAMVRSQQDRVCGTPCPADQGLSEDGRCLPSAILAKAARKPSPSALATYVPAGGAAAAGKPLPARSGWSATVTAARPTPPAVGAPAAPTPPQALAIPAPATPPPTEGRMALAGPVDGPTATAAADPRLAAKPTAQSGNTSRTRPSQRGPRFVSAPRPRSFVSIVFRRIDSRL